ncbi:hypothetical protein N2152v2_007064 [Parachlorella kessleri]
MNCSRSSAPQSNAPSSAEGSIGAAISTNSSHKGDGFLWRPSKTYDVVALSNLCVDVVVQVPELPPAELAARRELLDTLTASPPPASSWEVGGMTNFLIAAARLGMRTAAVGHTGDDAYGQFLSDILEAEGVGAIEPVAAGVRTPEQNQTLLCFVLISGSQHSFVSSYDFGPWPLLPYVDSLSEVVQQVLEDTEALFINGYILDEIPASVVVAAAQQAQSAGAAVFFDPGPRAWTFQQGERRAALDAILNVSDVVLMTQEEATAVTGVVDAEQAARHVLTRPGTRTEWCIVKQGAEGALLASRSRGAVHQQAAIKLPPQDVRDTVGCGDSFAAAVVLGYTREHSIPAVMALANAVGAATAMGSGAGRNVARAETVMRLLGGAAVSCRDGVHCEALQVLTAALSSSSESDR